MDLGSSGMLVEWRLRWSDRIRRATLIPGRAPAKAAIGGHPYPAGHFKFLRVWSVKFLHPARQDMMIVSLTLFPGQGLQRPL